MRARLNCQCIYYRDAFRQSRQKSDNERHPVIAYSHWFVRDFATQSETELISAPPATAHLKNEVQKLLSSPEVNVTKLYPAWRPTGPTDPRYQCSLILICRPRLQTRALGGSTEPCRYWVAWMSNEKRKRSPLDRSSVLLNYFTTSGSYLAAGFDTRLCWA